MLSEDEQREIEAEFSHYPNKQAVCIEAMKVVQRHRGWVTDENLADIGDLLDMTTDELDSVATFYNLIYREPVGRHIIHICNSVSCWVMGYEQVRRDLSERLGIDMGQTTKDNRFTFLPIQCLGHCELAPALMIDDDLHANLADANLEAILARYP